MELNEEGKRKTTYLNISALCAFTLFTILAVLQLENVLDAHWITLTIPLLWSIISVPLALHTYIHYSPKKIKTQLGNVVVLFTAYCCAAGLLTSGIMISLRVDGFLDAPWGLVFVPVWFVNFVFLLFTCFMCPGFMDPKIGMQRQAFLLFVYLATTTITSILVAVKLEGDDGTSWGVVFIPIWLCAFAHSFSIMHAAIKRKIFDPREVSILVLVTVAFMILALRLTGLAVPWTVVATPVWLLLGYFCFEIMYYKSQSRTDDEPLIKTHN